MFAKHHHPRGIYRGGLFRGVTILAGLLVHLAGASPEAQTVATNGVRTIAGAFAGHVDGNNTVSQLDTPWGIAHDGTNTIYIADFGNNALRSINVTSQIVETLLGGDGTLGNPLLGPIDVAVGRSNEVYIANYASRTVVRYHVPTRHVSTLRTFNDSPPVALDFDPAGKLFIAQEGGWIRDLSGAVVRSHRPGGQLFSGLVALGDNQFVVSDAGSHVVWFLNNSPRPVFAIAGQVGVAAFEDGPQNRSKLNGPQHITRAPDGGYVFADYLNHRVRYISPGFETSTLIGIDPGLWANFPGAFPGWADGPVRWAESRNPVGVAVAPNGNIYDTEIFYHILRETTGLLSTNSASTNLPITAVISPNKGFFPAGVEVTITSSNNIPFGPNVRIYYNLDRRQPTLSDPQIPIVGGRGVLFLAGPVDLGRLAVQIYNGDVPGPVQFGEEVALEPVGLVLSPDRGYYTNGVEVQIVSSNNAPFGPQVRLFYTLNATTPTTNSSQVPIFSGAGRLTINQPIDLGNLRVIAYNGTVPGPVAAGQSSRVPSPAFSPGAGFFLSNVVITVTNRLDSNGAFPEGTRLFYTTDGTTPDVNSTEIIPQNGRWEILLQASPEAPVDLADVRVIAIFGESQSEVGSGGNIQVPTPFFTPNAGYYPMGVRIQIGSTNAFPAGTRIYYTTDGEDPTTNSFSVEYEGTEPVIYWREARLDLRSLRVKAFVGKSSSATSAGQAVTFANPLVRGEVGVPAGIGGSNYVASIGSTYILPIVANMRDEQTMRSLQFVVELEPLPGSRPLDRTDVSFQVMSTNDFVQVTPATTSPPDSTISILRSNVNRVSISYFGTNSGFNVDGFATVAMLRIQFRPGTANGQTADHGDQYLLRIDSTTLSGTEDGEQKIIPLVKMPDRIITLSTNREQISYLLGDTAPGYWYNAGDFGNNRLENADVNNVIFAALGFRVPYFNSDAYWAMNVSLEGLFGDSINFTDAETVLRRSLGFDLTAVRRGRDQFGNLVDTPSPTGNFNLPLPPPPQTDGPVWQRDVLLYGGRYNHELFGVPVRLPVYAKADSGREIFGMQFVADVLPGNGALPVEGVRFIPAANAPRPSLNGSTVPGLGNLLGSVYVRWNNLEPGIRGTVLLGHVEYNLPFAARTGHTYTVVFHHADGAALDAETGALVPYSFETSQGFVALNTAIPARGAILPDEWLTHFFGSASENAAPESDPDDDGFTNYQEYLGGLDPAAADWTVKISSSGVVSFRWIGEAGKSYIVEKTEDFRGWNAVTGKVAGQDAFVEYNEPALPGKAGFYRLKIEP